MSPSRTILALSGGALLVAVAVTALPLLGGRITPSLHAVGAASRPWLAVSFVCFVGAFGCTVAAWRAALTCAGARLGSRQAAARLGVGSLVNSFAPAKLGDAVKVTLCSRAIDAPDRLWTAGGAYAALTAARALALASLVVVASATHAMPLWPVFVLVGGAAAVAAASAGSVRFRRYHRVASLLAGARALATDRRALAHVAGWTLGMQVLRIGGAVGVALALGLPHPLPAALVILAALDVAGAVPLTPGSIGIGSGAVAVALAGRGIGMAQALAAGLALQGVETLVSLACGSTGLAYLLVPRDRARQLAGIALVGASAVLAALVGVVVLDLV